jgi:1-deoxyxylulose-5-phosphate synthase
MKIKRLGRTGLKVSEVCLGTMTFGMQADRATSHAILSKAAELGVNFIDTADVYPMGGPPETRGRTEEFIGPWLKSRREDFILATKCRAGMGPHPWNEGLSRKHILSAVEDSLRRLQTDYIDLYQTHSPDAETPIDETLSALDDLVRSGKVRYIGCSNYGAWKLAQAVWTSDKLGLARFDCVQPRYNILFRQIEDELLPLCREEGVGVIAYNPLAGGFLTGKYSKDQDAPSGTRFDVLKGTGNKVYHNRYWQEAQFDAVRRLREYFDGRGKPLAQVAAAWVLRQPGVTCAIIGASRPEQLDGSVPGVDLDLDDDDLAACDDAWYSLPRPRDPGIALR